MSEYLGFATEPLLESTMPSLIRHFRHIAFLLAGLLAFSLPANADEALAAARPLERADLEAWLDGMVPATLAKDDIAGAVITVVKDGQVLFQKGYGYSDVAKRTPVDPEKTLFRPGSVSKLFTWTAVMQLVEAGKIDLDADINTYLDFKIPARADGPITMRHVMTHTAGFVTDDPWGDRVLGMSPAELDRVIATGHLFALGVGLVALATVMAVLATRSGHTTR